MMASREYAPSCLTTMCATHIAFPTMAGSPQIYLLLSRDPRMKNNSILARFIAVALYSGAILLHPGDVAATDSPGAGTCGDEPEEGCHVTAPRPPDFPPPPPPPSPSNPGSGPGNSGSGGTGTGSGLGPEALAFCFSLASGKPDGCTRQVAQAGSPQALFQSYGPNLDLDLYNPQNHGLRAAIMAASYSLSACYGDYGRDENQCEDIFSASMADIIQMYAPRPHINYQEDLDFIVRGVTMARWERDWRPLQHLSFGPETSIFSFQVPVPAWFSLMGHNQLLREAREQKVCEKWHAAWDGLGC